MTLMASSADSGLSNTKCHVVRQQNGVWMALCNTGSDGTTMMSEPTTPARAIPKHIRCRKPACLRAFAEADGRT